MTNYIVTLFGNRKGATIKKDYMVAECTSYNEARKLIESNGNWGNIREVGSRLEAVADNTSFILEVQASGLSCARLPCKAL